ncbi:hypothetical protein [Streptomyces sp. NPDC018000]|uniref:hypothetical protein n=1 Tax=Streptomyces sp. NPDC018000 TaxID=3365028 RepID=UPI0037B1AA82
MRHQLVSEAVQNCQEVLRYTGPDVALRMTLIRGTDAADTMDTASMLIAAYCQRDSMAMDTLASYPQTRQQRSRAAGPRESDRQEIAGMLGGPTPLGDDHEAQRRFSRGQGYAEGGLMPEADEQRLFTEACLHRLLAPPKPPHGAPARRPKTAEREAQLQRERHDKPELIQVALVLAHLGPAQPERDSP